MDLIRWLSAHANIKYNFIIFFLNMIPNTEIVELKLVFLYYILDLNLLSSMNQFVQKKESY